MTGPVTLAAAAAPCPVLLAPPLRVLPRPREVAAAAMASAGARLWQRAASPQPAQMHPPAQVAEETKRLGMPWWWRLLHSSACYDT